jgi:hypothetical protein
MSELPHWWIVISDGVNRTSVWLGAATTPEDACALALDDHPGWHVIRCDRDVRPYP